MHVCACMCICTHTNQLACIYYTYTHFLVGREYTPFVKYMTSFVEADISVIIYDEKKVCLVLLLFNKKRFLDFPVFYFLLPNIQNPEASP